MDGDEYPALHSVDLETIGNAIERSFAAFLADWDLRIEQRIEDGVKAALKEWLDAEADNLRETISEAIGHRLRVKR